MARWPVAALLVFTATAFAGLPDLRDTPTDSVSVEVGEEATLTCTVKDLSNHTVIWKRIKYGRADVLSANTLKVTNDPRINVIHSPDGDDWVLTISSARMKDTAQYVCEVNSMPAVQVSQMLTVSQAASASASPFSQNHIYTDCCVEQRVPPICLGFCTLRNIITGNTSASPQTCREHLPAIAACMADGRNHTPCCVRENIPEICRDVCVGKFGLINQTVVNHYTCTRYSRATLACIAEGIDLLPSPPRDVQVEPVSEKEIKISWVLPKYNINTLSHYIVNVTELASFDATSYSGLDFDIIDLENSTVGSGDRKGRMNNMVEKFTEIKVNSSDTSYLLTDLKPFTMYEIYLISVNSYGNSLPTYKLRTLTLLPELSRRIDVENITEGDNATLPTLPDIRGCCAEKGMTQERCLDLFCDPVKADLTNLTDMMICAPWISTSVMCLTGGADYTPCCRQRGLPDLCLPLCGGNISRIDFRYFRCIAYLSSYTGCLMEGYGVLASTPRDLVVNEIHSTWAILRWQLPEKLAETVTSYNVHSRTISEDQVIYATFARGQTPFLMDNLKPDTQYEVYVTAVNKYGASEGSERVLFQTLQQEEDRSTDQENVSVSSYNLTECCLSAHINNTCMPLCNYRAKMADLQRLAPACLGEFHKLLKCATGGRNHMPCCVRRSVSVNCASLCTGMITQFTAAMATMCVPYIPDIIHCMEDGSEFLPGPIRELHAVDMNASAVLLRWEEPLQSNVSIYEIKYQGEGGEANNDRPSTLIEESVNVTEREVMITDLKPNVLYSFYVIAKNEYGSSLPSSILTFNTSSYAENKSLTGVVSPPHSLTVTLKNTTYLMVSWLPPDFSHPSDAIQYTLYFKVNNDSEYANFTTTTLSVQLSNLVPNTEYAMYVTASTDKGESWPSEILRAWTDPVYPAFVEVPRIHPSTNIEEGGSMTVLCVASGTPVPTVAVFVNGVKFFEETTRHMVAHIPNITRDIDSITCTANNGYGTGSQATKRIRISYPPNLEAKTNLVGMVGQSVMLECIVRGFPQPHMTWWRDPDRHSQVLPGGKYYTNMIQDELGEYTMQLTITDTESEDSGNYYCSAENPFGNGMEEIHLKLQQAERPPATNVTECCLKQKVYPDCLDACSFDVDIESIVNRPNCIPEFSKLMLCAADGSDHRRCCQMWGVPKRCIGWCQGKAVHNAPLCILAWSRQIITCFEEGKHILPGPPQDIDISQLSETSALIQWRPPLKNAHVVQYYRVYWRSITRGHSGKFQNDTHALSMTVSGLKPGISYEFAVKAGNHYGSSLHTSHKFSLISNSVSQASTQNNDSNHTALAVGLIFAVLLLGAIIGGFIYFRRKYRPKSLGGVSFENPSYMRETMSGDAATPQANSSQDQVNGGVNPSDSGWRSEALHSPDNMDTFYEELKLGDDKADFKRAKTKF